MWFNAAAGGFDCCCCQWYYFVAAAVVHPAAVGGDALVSVTVKSEHMAPHLRVNIVCLF